MNQRQLVNLASLSFALLINALPGQALLLTGYASQEQAGSTSDTWPLGHVITNNSFPRSYIGTWRCYTTVTNSSTQLISRGTQTISEIHFVPSCDGRVVALWNQPGWSESQADVAIEENGKVWLKRVNSFISNGVHTGWTATSNDRFTKTSSDQILAESLVDQFQDGQYLGQYHTRSVLIRTDRL